VLNTLDLSGFQGPLNGVLPRPKIDEKSPVEQVAAIIERVKRDKDQALYELTEEFDQVKLDSIKLDKSLILDSLNRIPKELREALEEAADNISNYHGHAMVFTGTYEYKGIKVEQLIRPVKRAGLYIPGGKANYPSTVLMCAIPARVAGVEELCLCVPPKADLRIDDSVLAAALLCQIDEVYKVGGAQAIAAMAYGTQSIKPVDVIVGPGNKYVSLAKRMVNGQVGVPNAFQGPSEVVVVGDNTYPAKWAAIDVIVQAEHGPDGLAWFITWDEVYLKEVIKELENLVANEPRRNEIESTLKAGGYGVLAKDRVQAVEIANELAPEHLELMCKDAWELVSMVENAGAVFVGGNSPAAIGDYLAGPNHVLPTFRSARFSSGLSCRDFLRYSHAIELTADSLKRLYPFMAELSAAEGLHAHLESVRLRLEDE
jgi:histidinol dehydrogenase